MCQDSGHHEVPAVEAVPAEADWPGEVLALEPVDEVKVSRRTVARVAGEGLVILTDCGHAGIVNICHYTRRLTGVDRLHAVLGGFHLSGPLFEPVIDPTVDALERLAPDVLVPAHCTGWKATHALARRLPDAYIPNSVGTTFSFGAGAAA